MKKSAAIVLAICLLLALAGCGDAEVSPSPSTAPSVEPTSAPTDLPSAEPSDSPSAEPSHSAPDAAGLEQEIAKKWAVDRPDSYGLDPYSMTRLEYDLIVAHSDTVPVNIDPPIGAVDWLLRVTDDDSLYEVVAASPLYDEEGYEIYTPTWYAGDNGAGVDIETATALVVELLARPELLPRGGDRYLDDEEHYPSVLCKLDGEKVVIFATAHTDAGLGQDYGVFAVVPIALLDKGYTGNPYEIIGVNYGSSWQTLEG